MSRVIIEEEETPEERAVRFNKEYQEKWAEDEKAMMEEDEKEIQEKTFRRRQACFDKNRAYIDRLSVKGKGGRMRRTLISCLYAYASMPFRTEEEEYRAIGKYHRGMFAGWEKAEEKSGNVCPVMREIAREYGAFDW